MLSPRVALYARVSSERQAEDRTIDSQVAALVARMAQDGLAVDPEAHFLDAGYSGATLVRPALERLRDMAAAGALDRLYVHSPDRLARRYAYQVLLLDELGRAGVEVVFLNRSIGTSAEDDLLLQVQGMVAEYERAKILERSRRGKRHAARAGRVNVFGGAPYGYRYVRARDGNGEARYEIDEAAAEAVRLMFRWIGHDRLGIGQVCRQLRQAGYRTRSGKKVWDRTTVWGMLRNPAYAGLAAYGKTRIGPLPARLRPVRGASAQPRRAYGVYDTLVEERISVPVPAIVDPDLFAAVGEQLAENRRRNRQGARGARYLLQGLVVCQQCGYAYYGKGVSLSAAKGRPRHYAYYRCCGTDAYRFGGQRVCANRQVRTDLLDVAVWREVEELLEDPAHLMAEYQRRLLEACHPQVGQEGSMAVLEAPNCEAAPRRRSADRQLHRRDDRKGRVRTAHPQPEGTGGPLGRAAPGAGRQRSSTDHAVADHRSAGRLRQDHPEPVGRAGLGRQARADPHASQAGRDWARGGQYRLSRRPGGRWATTYWVRHESMPRQPFLARLWVGVITAPCGTPSPVSTGGPRRAPA